MDARTNVLVKAVRELHVLRPDVLLSVNTAAIIIACLLDVKQFVVLMAHHHVPPVAECLAPKVHAQLCAKMHAILNAHLVHLIAAILVLIIVRELAATAVMISALIIVICNVS